MERERLTQNLFDLSTAYARYKGLRLGSLSVYANCQSEFFGRISRGKAVDFKISTYDRLITWFSDNWPDELPWPVGLERPTVRQQHESMDPENHRGNDPAL